MVQQPETVLQAEHSVPLPSCRWTWLVLVLYSIPMREEMMAMMDNLMETRKTRMGMLATRTGAVLLVLNNMMLVVVTYQVNEKLCLWTFLQHFKLAFRLPKIFLRVLLEDKLTTTWDRTC